LYSALKNFLCNAYDVTERKKMFIEMNGADDTAGLVKDLNEGFKRQPAAGYLEGFHATVTALKANEAVTTKQHLVLQPEWYQLT
jgi:hypothetical protein